MPSSPLPVQSRGHGARQYPYRPLTRCRCSGASCPARRGGGGAAPNVDADPPAGVGRVDHVVDLEVAGGVDRLAVLVHAVDHLLERPLALVGVVDGLELLAVAEPHRALEAHAAELAGGPGHAEQRRLEAAAGHGLGAEAVALAQDDRAGRHGEVGAGDEQPADVAHQRGLLGLGPDHDPGRVAQEEHRQVEGVAELQEAGRLVGAVGVDGARQVHRVVGDDAHRAALDPDERGDHARGRSAAAARAPSPTSAMASTAARTS